MNKNHQTSIIVINNLVFWNVITVLPINNIKFKTQVNIVRNVISEMIT